jgi:predicted XRE-type DNA-binding protein
LRERIERRRGGAAKAARRLGLTQRRLDELMRGRLDKFTLDELMNLAQAAGLGVRVEIDAAA